MDDAVLCGCILAESSCVPGPGAGEPLWMGADQAFVYFRHSLLGVCPFLGGPLLFQSVVLHVCLYLSPCVRLAQKLTLIPSIPLGFNVSPLTWNASWCHPIYRTHFLLLALGHLTQTPKAGPSPEPEWYLRLLPLRGAWSKCPCEVRWLRSQSACVQSLAHLCDPVPVICPLRVGQLIKWSLQ